MSVISRMLNDLERRGVATPGMPRPASQHEQGAPVAKAVKAERDKIWRGLLLSTSLLVGIVGVDKMDMPSWMVHLDAPTDRTHGTVTAPAVPLASNSPTQTVAHALHLDWALSLNLLKSRNLASTPSTAVKVSLSPSEDLTHDPVDVSDRPDSAPASLEGKQAQASAARMPSTNAMVIDPPAAGRSQTTSQQAVAAYRHAMDLAEQGRDALALDAAVQSLKLDAQHLPARRLAVSLALAQNKLDVASSLIEEGLKLDPQDSELLVLHARRLAVAGANEQALTALQAIDRPSAEAQGLRAGLLAKTGHYAQAAQAYESALKVQPDNSTWWLGLGVALNAQGQQAMAREAFIRARKLGQLSPDVQAWLDQQI